MIAISTSRGRERLYDEARALIHTEWSLGHDAIGRSEVDRVMADLKYRLAKKLDEEALEMASDPYGTEFASSHVEDAVSAAVDVHLPEERLRIGELLAAFPAAARNEGSEAARWARHALAAEPGREDRDLRDVPRHRRLARDRKSNKFIPARAWWCCAAAITARKLRRNVASSMKDGPRVLVCTAAGREGINLQFARILFNFDLPWNPMDMEQRIGRIHRYGQAHTAQVYNLVLSDTIEGRIFLLLDDKLTEIARTLGKVDAQGNVAEDLRSQILGQLSERLNYDRLYQEALSDPELKRTAVELEAALSNAREAREVVFDLFQDLDGFSLDDYKPFSDISSGMDRLVQFLGAAVADRNWRLVKVDASTYDLLSAEGTQKKRFTLDRDTVTANDAVDLMGLDHPLIQQELGRWRSLPPEQLGVALSGGEVGKTLLSLWLVETATGTQEKRVSVQPIAVRPDGTRVPNVERQVSQILHSVAAAPALSPDERLSLFANSVEPTLQRELKHKAGNRDGGFSVELIGYVELVD